VLSAEPESREITPPSPAAIQLRERTDMNVGSSTTNVSTRSDQDRCCNCASDGPKWDEISIGVAERPALKTTSVSLLERLRASKPEESDWRRLHSIYLPLIQRWLGRIPGLSHEADDLAQDVLLVVVREIPQFERQREGSFRAWLRLVTVNRLRTHRKQKRRRPTGGSDPTDTLIDQLADPSGDLAKEWDREHDRHVFQQLLTIVRPDFGTSTWVVFQQFALDGLSAATVAANCGVTVNAVIQAKARILRRLRQEAGAFLD
jgi:RNA polymerase sigma-70 factor, ECF subfamily